MKLAKNCKDCYWHFVYIDFRFNGQELWSKTKKKYIIPCHNGNKKGTCKNYESKIPWWQFWK